MSTCSLRLPHRKTAAKPAAKPAAKTAAVPKVPETILKTTKVRESQRERALKAKVDNVKVCLACLE